MQLCDYDWICFEVIDIQSDKCFFILKIFQKNLYPGGLVFLSFDDVPGSQTAYPYTSSSSINFRLRCKPL